MGHTIVNNGGLYTPNAVLKPPRCYESSTPDYRCPINYKDAETADAVTVHHQTHMRSAANQDVTRCSVSRGASRSRPIRSGANATTQLGPR